MLLVRKIIFVLSLLVSLFFLCNFFYKKYEWEMDLLKLGENKMLEKVINCKSGNEVLYFSESSNATFSEFDTTKQSIAQLINTYFPKLDLVAIERGAIHAAVYKSLVKRISANTKVIIVTMNLRSFNSGWINSKYENSCLELQVANASLPELLKKMMLVFKAYDYKDDWKRQGIYWRDMKSVKLKGAKPLQFKTAFEWANYFTNVKFKDVSVISEKQKVELVCQNIYSFAFNIDTLTNPRINDYDDIVMLCKKKNIKVYFNLLAENVDYADSLVGKELVTMMKENSDLLVDYYSRKGVQVIDNLELVKGKDFIDQNWTTEHYNEKGRMIIATNVAHYLKQDYKEFYVDK